jgi:hypothetical protein
MNLVGDGFASGVWAGAKRSRRLLLAAACAVLAFSACGGASSTPITGPGAALPGVAGAGAAVSGWSLPFAKGTLVKIGSKGLHADNFGSVPNPAGGTFKLNGSSEVEGSLDLVVQSTDTDVYPIGPGKVLEAWSECNVVLVDQGGGTWVEYMHLNLSVATGDTVTPDKPLGKVMAPYDRSKTSPCYDDSDAPHLHFAFLSGAGSAGQYQPMAGKTLCGHEVASNGDITGLGKVGGGYFAVPDCGAAGGQGAGAKADLTTWRWSRTADAPFNWMGGRTANLKGGQAVIIDSGDGGDDLMCCDCAVERFPSTSIVGEMYDPARNRWLKMPVTSQLTYVSAVLPLPDGSALVTGGIQDTENDTTTLGALKYTPSTNAWSPVSAPSADTSGAAVLADGRPALFGGYDTTNNPVDTVQAFAPATGKWTVIGHLAIARAGALATTLPDGKVLIQNGRSSTPIQDEIFDPATGKSTAFGSGTASAHDDTETVVLADGSVISAHLISNDDYTEFHVDLYQLNEAGRRWTQLVHLTQADGANTLLLNDGSLLMVGGVLQTEEDSGCPIHPASTAVVDYDATGKPTKLASLTDGAAGVGIVQLGDGRVLIYGGESGIDATDPDQSHDTMPVPSQLFGPAS